MKTLRKRFTDIPIKEISKNLSPMTNTTELDQILAEAPIFIRETQGRVVSFYYQILVNIAKWLITQMHLLSSPYGQSVVLK